MSEVTFDVIVIGGGPGGYVAAIRASQLGFKTALVEAEHLGGVCLNWGCIPTKALLRSAELYQQMKRAADFGLRAQGVDFDLAAMVGRSREISTQLTGGIRHLMKSHKITVIEGYGRLIDRGKIAVTDTGTDTRAEPFATLEGDHIIIATGARARQLPGSEALGDRIWYYRDALAPSSIPESLLVIGSGAIGLEFANFYHSFGAQVTVVEMMDQITPTEDREIAQFAQAQMQRRTMNFMLNTKVLSLREHGDHTVVEVERDGQRETLSAERVISAIGVSPNVENLDLHCVGTALDQSGFIATDGYGRTNVDGLYAIGDVAGPPCLAHKASREAVICIEKIAAQPDVQPLDKTMVPGCTYTFPQISSIGLTEAQARKADGEIRVGKFPFLANGKAIALGEPEGLVKVIFSAQSGELLGAHLVGGEVTELIQGFGIAKTLESTEKELMQAIFPHPTLSEMMQEAVLNAYGKSLHYA